MPNFTRQYLVTHTNYTRLTLLNYWLLIILMTFFSRFSCNVFFRRYFRLHVIAIVAFFYETFLIHLHIPRSVFALMREILWLKFLLNLITSIERFSVKRRMLIWLWISTPPDWFKKSPVAFSSNQEWNQNQSLAHVTHLRTFSALATRDYIESYNCVVLGLRHSVENRSQLFSIPNDFHRVISAEV